MTPHPILRRTAWLALILWLGVCTVWPRSARSQQADPVSAVPVLAVAPLAWEDVERRVRRGVVRGVAGFRFGAADRQDVIAVAVERAWSAFLELDEALEHPEAWGRTIAVRVALDELRRRKRDPLVLAVPVEDRIPAGESPFDAVDADERCTLLRERIAAWPQTERRLAQLLLDGEAETVTAAAWQLRAEEQAQGVDSAMYPQRARLLLAALRADLEDLREDGPVEAHAIG